MRLLHIQVDLVKYSRIKVAVTFEHPSYINPVKHPIIGAVRYLALGFVHHHMTCSALL